MKWKTGCRNVAFSLVGRNVVWTKYGLDENVVWTKRGAAFWDQHQNWCVLVAKKQNWEFGIGKKYRRSEPTKVNKIALFLFLFS